MDLVIVRIDSTANAEGTLTPFLNSQAIRKEVHLKGTKLVDKESNNTISNEIRVPVFMVNMLILQVRNAFY